MAPSPLVCVTMPVYNARAFLAEAMDSVLAQTYPHWQLIAVDDASTDGSWDMLCAYAARDARIRPYRQSGHAGIVAARNRALREAGTDCSYIAILDSDDVALPERLAEQVEFLEAHPNHALVGGQTEIIDEHSRVRGRRRYPLQYAQICRAITRYNPFAQSAVMLRRSVLDRVGVYDPAYPRCQDYDLWLRIAAQHPVANLDRPVIRYRISAQQGKRTHLRQSLQLTLRLQRRWLLHPRFLRPENAAFVALEHVLPLLPDRMILALFERVAYRADGSGR
jgi:glycosyltransferase involved in cell wall biosynthesis